MYVVARMSASLLLLTSFPSTGWFLIHGSWTDFDVSSMRLLAWKEVGFIIVVDQIEIRSHHKNMGFCAVIIYCAFSYVLPSSFISACSGSCCLQKSLKARCLIPRSALSLQV
jgi:hypothetical protein